MENVIVFEDRLTRAVAIRCDLLHKLYPGESFEPLRHLPDLYRFFWHLAFDMEIIPAVRHYAASLAFYIFSTLDYVSEDTPVATGYLDDLAVSIRGFRSIEAELGPAKIAEHWKSIESLALLIPRTEELFSRHLPDRVEIKISLYLQR